MPSKYLSRKFLMGLAGLVFLVINLFLEVNGKPPIDVEKLLAAVGIVVSYIVTEGYLDSKRVWKP